MALNLDHQRDRISTASGNITISTSGALRVPVGNTAQRPQSGVVQTGQIRFNTQTTQYEGYNGVSWTSLGGVKDVDQDTYITAEQASDDDTLRFYTAGVQRLTINNLGEVEIFNDTSITQNFRVDGLTTLDTLDVNSQATIASLNVEDLAQNSVVFAGLNGELEDDVNFTYNGSVMEVDTNGAIGLPRGTQAQRPGSPNPGYIRFSTDATNLEFWNGSTWNVVGTGSGAASAFTTISVNGQNNVVADGPSDTLTIVGGSGINVVTDGATDTITFSVQQLSAGTSLSDTDGDTGINLETTPDEDTIRFTTDGTERMVIDNTGLVSILGTGALEIPAGTTAERPTTLAQGQIRYNTTDATFEGYDGAAWGSLGGVKDVDGDTYITAELNSDEDYLRFYTANSERFNIDNLGQVTFGDSATNNFYTFPTQRGSDGQILIIDQSGNLVFSDFSTSNTYYQDTAPAAPTNTISTGDFWFDTGTTGELYIYTGNEWISTTPGADTGFIKQNYTGDGSTTQYDTQTGVNGGTVSLVFLNGVLLQPINDYTEASGVVTFVVAPLLGDQIDIMITGELVTLSLNPLGLNNHNLISVDAAGELTVSSLIVSDLTDNRVVIAGASGQLEDDANLTFDGTNLVISTTGAVQIPVGTTAERPTPVQGQIRYNTDDSTFEGYNGATWGSLAAGLTSVSLNIAGDSGTDAVDTSVDTLTFVGDTGITTAVTNNQVSIDLDDTTVTPGVYGNATTVPVITVDQQGRVTSVTTAAVTSTPSGVYTVHTFTGNGADDTFSTSNTNIDDNQIFIDGLLEDSANYTIAPNGDVTFNTPPANNTTIIVYAYTTSINLVNLEQLGIANHNNISVDVSGNVGLGTASPQEKLHVDGAIRIDGVSSLATASTTLATVTPTAIDTFAITAFRSCKYTIQATNTVTNEYQTAEAIVIHDGSSAYITTYGTIFTGSASILSLDADVNSGNVRLLATASSADSTEYKITRISTLV